MIAAPLRVLVVEDSALDAAVLDRRLRMLGRPVHISHAASLAVAVDLAPGQDLVLLDLGLPDAEGLEGVRTLAELQAEVPIVVLTATDDEATAEACVAAGAEDYLVKGRTDVASLRRALVHAELRTQRRHNRELRAHLELLSGRVQRAAGVEFPPEWVDQYAESLRRWVESDSSRPDTVPLAEALVQGGADSTTALRVHVAAVERFAGGATRGQAQALAAEGRLLLLDLLCRLGDAWRRRAVGPGA